MSNLVRPLTTAQEDAAIKTDETEGIARRELINLDTSAETVAQIGFHAPSGITLSSGIADAALEDKGTKGIFAKAGQWLLNLVTKGHNHGTGATLSDDVKARQDVNKLNAQLDKIDPSGQMLRELDKQEPVS